MKKPKNHESKKKGIINTNTQIEELQLIIFDASNEDIGYFAEYSIEYENYDTDKESNYSILIKEYLISSDLYKLLNISKLKFTPDLSTIGN